MVGITPFFIKCFICFWLFLGFVGLLYLFFDALKSRREKTKKFNAFSLVFSAVIILGGPFSLLVVFLSVQGRRLNHRQRELA